MKTYFTTLVFCLLSLTAFSQQVKIVFDVTSSDPAVHASAMRHVKGMATAYPDSEFEMVIYSGALNMMLADKSTVEDDVKEALSKGNVSFKVCAQTMKRHEMDESSLIKGVTTVPDGILEIIDKQGQGWGYIKETP